MLSLVEQYRVNWLYLVPTIAYGVMFFGQTFPKSEASAKGLSFAEMFKDVGILGSLVACGLIVVFLVARGERPLSVLFGQADLAGELRAGVPLLFAAFGLGMTESSCIYRLISAHNHNER